MTKNEGLKCHNFSPLMFFILLLYNKTLSKHVTAL